MSIHLGRFTEPGGVQRLSVKLRSAFPNYRIVIGHLIVDGDHVAARWTLHGTLRGELLGVPPTGQPTTLPGIGWLHLADGKITETLMAEY